MKIVTPTKQSLEVSNFAQIDMMASEMQAALEHDDFQRGPWNKGSIALHHSQVEAENPFNFFVIKRQIVHAKSNEVVCVVNPKILEKDKNSKTTSREGCISFPFRQDIKVPRYSRVKVEYQLPDKNGTLITRTEWIEGFMAYIFQHEVQHSLGGHIYK